MAHLDERKSDFIVFTCFWLLLCGPIALLASLFAKSHMITVLFAAFGFGMLVWIFVAAVASMDNAGTKLRRIWAINSVLMALGFIGAIALFAYACVTASLSPGAH